MVTGVYDEGITTVDKCRLSPFDIGSTPPLCSSTDGSYCVNPWDATNFNERHAVSARSLRDYAQQVYGLGSTPGNTNLFLGPLAGQNTSSGGTGNVFIGEGAGSDNTSGDNNIMIGEGIAFNSHTSIIQNGSNQLNIGNLVLGKMPTSTSSSTLKYNSVGNAAGLAVNGEVVVNGYVRIGEISLATTTCNAANEGVLGYNNNPPQYSLQYCNGSNWVTLASGSTPVAPVANPFTNPAPTISNVNPGTGPEAGGTDITISGTNFVTGNNGSSATIGGNPCSSVTVNSASQITCRTPSGTPGNVTVRVINPDGQIVDEANGFEYIASAPPSPGAPTISSILPMVAPTSSKVITINGSNFLNVSIVKLTIPRFPTTSSIYMR